MSRKKNEIKIYIPARLAVFFTLLAVLLVPWTIYLAYSLPRRYIERYWDISWVGLDIGIITLLLLTGILASIKSRMVIITLVATSSFLLVDSWFDIVSAAPGAQLIQSVGLAIFVEIPLSALGFYLAYRTINKNLD